jgi:hypothetical protein
MDRVIPLLTVPPLAPVQRIKVFSDLRLPSTAPEWTENQKTCPSRCRHQPSDGNRYVAGAIGKLIL